jgi:predicted dehydrogenase
MKQCGDVAVTFISGYLERDEAHAASLRERGYDCHAGDAWWHDQLVREPPDAILISTPNALHGPAIRHAFRYGINVAVDKPTAIDPLECYDLVRLADQAELVFVTLSQRRYERLYLVVKRLIDAGSIGSPELIEYLMSHDVGQVSAEDNWFLNPALSGGGALMSSGYHGIDTVLWLFGPALRVTTVAGATVTRDFGWGLLDVVSSASIRFQYGGCSGILNVAASYCGPRGSLDENIKIFGSEGAIRIMRDLPQRVDQRAAHLSYQDKEGTFHEYLTAAWQGQRWAPLEDFLNAVVSRRRQEPWRVLSPALDSIATVCIIDAAYRSAKSGGGEITMETSEGLRLASCSGAD